jgi:hypothetical protein
VAVRPDPSGSGFASSFPHTTALPAPNVHAMKPLADPQEDAEATDDACALAFPLPGAAERGVAPLRH